MYNLLIPVRLLFIARYFDNNEFMNLAISQKRVQHRHGNDNFSKNSEAELQGILFN